MNREYIEKFVGHCIEDTLTLDEAMQEIAKAWDSYDVEEYDVYDILDAIPLDNLIYPSMYTDELLELIKKKFGDMPNDFDERDLAEYLQLRGYNITIYPRDYRYRID